MNAEDFAKNARTYTPPFLERHKQGSTKPQLFLEEVLDVQNENLLDIKTNIKEVECR